ncbi:eukaryotic cytochrome b561-domain-containing protein [Haematococcus lacustris]
MAGAHHGVAPEKWAIGPPAPKAFAYLARLLMLLLVVTVGHWIRVHLGGVAIMPVSTGPDANDTGALFNWHPLLMVLGFGVFMAEALMSYQAPLMPWLTRQGRKTVHWVLHSLALLCIALGLLAAYKSHSLKLPVPIPNWYSPHSFLGLTTMALLAVQFVVAAFAYLYPGASLAFRLALGPLHKFSGKAVWVMGLAAIATGLQEKTSFLQMGKGLKGDQLYSGIVRLPAVAMVLLALLGLVVLYHQVPPAAPAPLPEDGGDKSERHGLLAANGMDA